MIARKTYFQVVFHLRQSSYGASRGAAMEWMQSVWWSGHRAIGMPCQVTIGYAGRRTWDQPRLLTAGIADIIQMCAGVDNPRLISDIFQTRPAIRDYRIADTSFSVNVNSIFHLSLFYSSTNLSRWLVFTVGGVAARSGLAASPPGRSIA